MLVFLFLFLKKIEKQVRAYTAFRISVDVLALIRAPRLRQKSAASGNGSGKQRNITSTSSCSFFDFEQTAQGENCIFVKFVHDIF